MANPLSMIGSLLLSILPFAAVGLSLAVLIDWLRQRRAVRRAGVSEQSPGCTKCLYVVRGWNSSVCPECGTDVARHGVVIGPRMNLVLKLVAVFVVTLAIVLPLCMLGGLAVFTQSWRLQAWQMTSSTQPAFECHIRTTSETTKLQNTPRFTTLLMIAPAGSLAGLLISGRAGQWEPQPLNQGVDDNRIRRINVGPDDPVPSAFEIERKISEIAAIDATEALGCATVLRQLMIDSRGANPPGAGVTNRPGASYFISSGTGTGSRTNIRPVAWYLIWTVSLGAALLAAALVFRRHRPGWRPVGEGEWIAARPAAI